MVVFLTVCVMRGGQKKTRHGDRDSYAVR